jgi:putative proteasome-type protease
MTYCVAMSLDAGMIFASDSRTNAGVDQVGRFSKMRVFSREGDRSSSRSRRAICRSRQNA